MSFLCKKLNSPSGALFLVDTQSKDIKSAARLSQNSTSTITFKPGEGQVGQCYLNEEIIQLKNIPDNYINTISSSLGNTNPSEIIFSPFIFKDSVVRILELTTFKHFTKSQTNIIKRISDHCGAFFHSRNEENKIKDLLNESKTLKIENRIHQISYNLNSIIKEARNEINFLVNTPPISGIKRANNNQKFDPKGQSTFEQWVNRFNSINTSLLRSKDSYSQVTLRIKENSTKLLELPEDANNLFLNAENLADNSFKFIQHESKLILVTSKEFDLGDNQTGQLILVSSLQSTYHLLKKKLTLSQI